MLSDKIIKSRTVSVWGVGYLGYTTIFKLQNSGFNVLAYDLNRKQLEAFGSGNYPDKERVSCWSNLGYLPKIDLNRVKIVSRPQEMFRDSSLHIIAIPEREYVMRLAKIFPQELKKSKATPLIIFESAFIPGHIEKGFVKVLREKGLFCGKDYLLAALFRTDWSIEAFIAQKEKMPVAGYCAESLDVVSRMLDYLGVAYVKLNSLKEAEIYANSLGVVQAMVNDFFRQLALGYPEVNIKALSRKLFKNISLEDCDLNMGTGGTKMTFALDYLIEGSDRPGNLTLLKEFQEINLTSVLSYAEYIIRKSYKSVAILGVSYKGSQKDLTLSPAVTLADYLLKNSLKVSLNDPACSRKEITGLARGVKAIDFPGNVFQSEVVIVASDHNLYKYLSQGELDRLKKNTKLVIDNYGVWRHLDFGKGITYYEVGTGTLNLSK